MNLLQEPNTKVNALKVRINDIDRQISNLLTQRDTAHKELAAAQPKLLKTMKNLKRKKEEIEEYRWDEVTKLIKNKKENANKEIL